MKCPHCSYVSFEYLNTCKKCSKDLTSHKSQYGIDFLEPIPLGILTFVETGAQEESVSPDDISTFATGEDVYLETGEGEVAEESEDVGVEVGDETSDEGFHFDLGDSTDEYGAGETMAESPVEEAAAEEAVEIDDSGLEIGEAEEAAEEPIEISGESSSELEIDISDTGGEAELEVGELGVDTGDLEAEAPELTVDTGDMEPESAELAVDTGDMEPESAELTVDTGDLEPESAELTVDTGEAEAVEEAPEEGGIELSEDFDESIASDSGFSLGLGEDFSSDDEEIDFSSFGGGDSDIGLGLEDSGAGEAEKKPEKDEEADDFDEIELSLDDKDMMDSGEEDSGDDLDLGGLEIEMEEDK